MIPAPPPAAQRLFGDRLPSAVRYAEFLASEGVLRGLIGPREADRIWERHLLNCAVLTELIPHASYVVDVGSGAGLPGIVLAVARPDLTVVLVEPLARRTVFLDEMVAALNLPDHVFVIRSRAEDAVLSRPADIVTARALAPLDRLAAWCLPLAVEGGRVLALKGASAADEIATHSAAIRRHGGSAPTIRQCGDRYVESPTTVVEFVRERSVVPMPIGSPQGVARRRGGIRRR